MYQRLLQVSFNMSFFLFGARGSGKSTFLQQILSQHKCLWIDLLNPEEERNFALHPEDLIARIEGLYQKDTKEFLVEYVVIDEVQKIPKLFDVVHMMIEKSNIKFILTGSSARKLKLGASNLLAGRAFVYHLFPFVFLETKKDFNLQTALEFGMLPKLSQLKNAEDKKLYLQAYAQTYLKEEIWAEQLIRKLDPFRKFLEVAAQCNGKILNYLNIARDVGVDDKTIKIYFQILEDTWLGFYLEPFHTSVRKRLTQKPKFYFFDIGVTRALGRILTVPVQSSTSYYGECFEHFIVCEIYKLCQYFFNEYKLFFYHTKDGAEIDLVVDRPGQKKLFIEIKSTSNLRIEHVATLSKLSLELPDNDYICLSQDNNKKQFDKITCYFWQDGIKALFLPPV